MADITTNVLTDEQQAEIVALEAKDEAGTITDAEKELLLKLLELDEADEDVRRARGFRGSGRTAGGGAGASRWPTSYLTRAGRSRTIEVGFRLRAAARKNRKLGLNRTHQPRAKC